MPSTGLLLRVTLARYSPLIPKTLTGKISARQTAMDNASKNAGDMINKFSLLYNRFSAFISLLIKELVKQSSPLNSLISSRVPVQFSLV